MKKYADREDVIVLGAPRGGVPVAFEVATRLGVPLDIFVLRKLGVPGHEELAFGAIASGGVRILNQETIEALGLTGLDIERVTEKRKTGTGAPGDRVSGRAASARCEGAYRDSRR